MLRSHRSSHAVLLAVLCLVASGQVRVRADVFAAVNVPAPAPRTDFDVAIVNAALGSRVALPAGVNTTAFEIYPSISSDGQRLLFKRFGGNDGQRLLLVDTANGQLADVFTPTEIALNPVFNSSLSSDGRTVYTGRRFRQGAFGAFLPTVTVTDVAQFPAGPFPHSLLRALIPTFQEPGIVTDVAIGKSSYALRIVRSTGVGQLLIQLAPNLSPGVLSDPDVDFGRPAIQELTFGARVLFGRRPIAFSSRFDSDLSFLPPVSQSPRLFATEADELHPAVTSDGRYLAFVRHGSDGHERLFVVDSFTGTFLNASGVDLGVITTRGIGSLSLYQRTVITSSLITSSGVVTGTLAERSSVGILVQRILGESRQHGGVEYELEMVGRVPLGEFEEGHLSARWNLAVDGQALAPGRYLVTLRAVEGSVVRELGRPHVLRVR